MRSTAASVPEIASRKHVEKVSAVAQQALAEAALAPEEIDGVAVTYAPGLIGALLTGIGFAKGLAYGLGVPLIPVHHLRGHIAACYLAETRQNRLFSPLSSPAGTAISSGWMTILPIQSSAVRVTMRRERPLIKWRASWAPVIPGGAAIERIGRRGIPKHTACL